jgi:hypothetical protein
VLITGITWRGRTPYEGTVGGPLHHPPPNHSHVGNIEPDGHCAKVSTWGDTFGVRPLVAACDAGVSENITFDYGTGTVPRADRVLVNVCLWRNKNVSHCSGWK